MSIKPIATDELRRMRQGEGLILQGCGGDLQEWLDGINDLFTEEKLLLNGTKFENSYVFEHDGLTNLLFPFDDSVKLDMGRLAIWRLKTHEQFGGTWLSDYVENRLGGFLPAEQEKAAQKPNCPLVGSDGNIWNLMGIASRTLKDAGLGEQAKEMCDRIRKSGNYYKALRIIGEYVNITSVDDMDEDEGMEMRL